MKMAITPVRFPTPFSAPIWAGSADSNVPAVGGTSGYLAGEVVIYGAGTGVYGGSGTGVGVHGVSGGDGVKGECTSNQHAGVSGVNNSGNQAGNGGPGVYGFSSNLDGVQGWSRSSQNAGVSARNTAGGYGVWAQAKTAGYFDGDVEVTGNLTVNVDVVLSGADFAEDFAVRTIEGVEPGAVMALDENGVLRPCEKSYDRKVAGVISGAGDFRPGLILDRRKSAPGRMPIALVGKVYCKVDAAYGAIEVGDLLTTSPTLGHAMKASDPAKGFGSVLGKALRPLHTGQGLIPVLVSLQ
jgi:hypothetical protein